MEAENRIKVRIKVDHKQLKAYFFSPDFTDNLKILGNLILNQQQTLC